MAYFPDVKSFDKFLNNDWKSLVYGEKSETWNEKMYSDARQVWDQIFEILESRGRQLQNYWPLYAALVVGSLIILAMYKSLRYVRTIELRKFVKSERSANREICTEVSGINSDDGNDKTEDSSEKPCPTSRSVLDDATASPADHARHDSAVSPDTAVIAVDGNQSGEFLINFINSMRLGDDAIDHTASTKHSTDDSDENKEIINLQESTHEKVDSDHYKKCYVPRTCLEPSEDQKPSDSKIPPPSKSMTTDTKNECLRLINSRSNNAEPEETIKNMIEHWNRLASRSPESATVNTASTNDGKSTGQVTSEPANSTMAVNHESSSICCADELLSQSSKTEDYIFPRTNNEKSGESSTIQKIKPDCNNLEVVFTNFVQKLPELDLSPITRDTVKTENPKKMTESEFRTDSKHRCRSLSHDNQIASNVGYIDNRRGSSVSPAARNKNKQRFVTQMQSKIPTLSPVAHRTLHRHMRNDEKIEEAADQIRSVLLRKLKEVWEQHPRDITTSPNRSLNSSQESSIYYTPECVSKIPLPRKSPRHIDTKDHSRLSRVGSQSARSENHSEQSKPGYSGITNDIGSPDEVSMVPLHSTPKISPFSRDSDHKR